MGIPKRYFLRVTFKVIDFELVHSWGYLSPDAAKDALRQLMPDYVRKGAHYVRCEVLGLKGELIYLSEISKPKGYSAGLT